MVKNIIRLSEPKDEIYLNKDLNIINNYKEAKTAYFVVVDEFNSILAGLGIDKIEGKENTCILKDLYLKDDFCDILTPSSLFANLFINFF